VIVVITSVAIVAIVANQLGEELKKLRMSQRREVSVQH
jgi:hypothetical protein